VQRQGGCNIREPAIIRGGCTIRESGIMRGRDIKESATLRGLQVELSMSTDILSLPSLVHKNSLVRSLSYLSSFWPFGK
jgi:hypothetical protein